MIKWLDSYSIGIAQLDEQHKNLFQYCNDIEQGLNHGGLSKPTLAGALRFFERYVKDHFGQEENCMHKYACPIAEKNKFAHQKFIETYKMFQKRITEEGESERLLKELHHFLETWLTEHICKIDVQLKPCLQKSR